MSNNLTAAQLVKRSLDTFLAKDMKGWADLCHEDVVVEFPFAPDDPERSSGAPPFMSICATIPTSSTSRRFPH